MDVYITTCHNDDELGEFLKEWTGKSYQLETRVLPYGQTYLVGRDRDADNKIVGCAGYYLIGDPFWNRSWCLVENVFVTPSYRNQGIAKKIMEEIELLVFNDSLCEFIKLTTRKDLGKKLYRGLGYEEGCSFYKSRH